MSLGKYIDLEKHSMPVILALTQALNVSETLLTLFISILCIRMFACLLFKEARMQYYSP